MPISAHISLRAGKISRALTQRAGKMFIFKEKHSHALAPEYFGGDIKTQKLSLTKENTHWNIEEQLRNLSYNRSLNEGFFAEEIKFNDNVVTGKLFPSLFKKGSEFKMIMNFDLRLPSFLLHSQIVSSADFRRKVSAWFSSYVC